MSARRTGPTGTSTHYLGVHEPAGGAAARARIIIQIQRRPIPRLECPAARDDGGAPLGWHDRGRGGDLGAAENASEYSISRVIRIPVDRRNSYRIRRMIVLM